MRVLPARWARVTPAVLILLGVGAAGARAGEPVQAGRDRQPGRPAARPEQKKIKFSVRGEPWPRVFDWLSRESGKPVINQYKVAGSFSIHVPEGASYTLPETIDLI